MVDAVASALLSASVGRVDYGVARAVLLGFAAQSTEQSGRARVRTCDRLRHTSWKPLATPKVHRRGLIEGRSVPAIESDSEVSPSIVHARVP